MIKITVKYNGQFSKELKTLSRHILLATDDALNTASIIIAGKVRQKLHSGPRSGRLYKRGLKYHRASAPGEPPKSDTGNLANHTYSSHPKFLVAQVISDASYSNALEYGTSKMAARPYMMVTVNENESLLNNLVDAAIKRAINT